MKRLAGALFLCAVAQFPAGGTALAQQKGESLFGVDAPAVTYGRYVRVELGAAISGTDSGDWLPPGQDDPRVFFDLSGETRAMGSAAIGFDWMNGFRADVSLSRFGAETVDGDWSRTEPPTPGPHASMSADVNATALMANIFYLPLQQKGRNSRFQPFLTAGAGLSFNDVDSWSRINPDATQEVREFRGDTSTSLAWSVGFGASWQVSPTGRRPLLAEASYRYYDLGTARGSAEPAPGSGTSSPRAPLSFDAEEHVVSLGLRIPLR